MTLKPPATSIESGPQAVKVGTALLGVMLIWGSSFLAIKYAVDAFPPFMLGSIRFLIAGGALFAVSLMLGRPLPTWREWVGAAVVGTVMLACNTTPLAIAEQSISSGLAAIGVASIPLWTALFAGILQAWPGWREWLALAVGLGGVVLLNLEGEFQANPTGAVAIIIAAAGWALGTVLTQKVPLPAGITATAAEMLSAGVVLGTGSLVMGEHFPPNPHLPALLGMGYMTLFSSLLGISLHHYLLKHVRPVVANCFAYTNPIVAVGLGIVIAGETISWVGLGAMAVILTGLVMLGRSRR